MTFHTTLEKIESSPAFINFKKKYPDAELCAGFFVLDFEENAENSKVQQQLDYCLPDSKVFTFILNHEINYKEAETIKKEKLEKIEKDIKVDLDDVQQILTEKMNNDGIKSKVNKIIAVLQKYQGKQIWNLTCILEGLTMLHLNINSEDGEILKFEKKSMFDFIKRVK